MPLKRLPRDRALPIARHWVPYSIAFPPTLAFARVGFWCAGGMIVTGKEHLFARWGQRVIVAANHISDMDPPFLSTAAYPFTVWYMAKEELFRIPVLGALCHMIHGFPVVRGAVDRVAIRFAEQRLENDEALGIFPEGRVNWNPQEMMPFQEGVAMLALHTASPIIPAAIVGTERMWPYGKFFPRRASRPARIAFGAPMFFDHLTGNRRARVRAVLAQVREAIETMRQEQLRLDSGG